ncbi:hypothetical protein COO60DRAFT_303443 [Scenedesmus sp. NREL 46B-D3]|nr:hypothetical protein COO60DRAFT_303443 [Scenedesmus sp. NREL 46B-D3]
MCGRESADTTNTAVTAGLQVSGAAATSTATTNPAAELQEQQAEQQELQTAQQQQFVEPPLQQQQPQEPQQQPVLQEEVQALLQQPQQQPPTIAGQASLQQPAAAETPQQQLLVPPTPLQPMPAHAPATAADTDAAVPVSASQQQQQQQQPPQPSPVRRLLNLAELADGASVVAANPEAKKPERAINKNIDSFMKNDCNARKWMIMELSQLGTVETVQLTMKELYSSRVHTFRVFGRSTHPRKDGPDLAAGLSSDTWQLLGSFTAENRRGTQAFSLPQRSRVRYLLITFDTHYGSEAICAMNWIEVLGVSAAQELEEALALQELEVEGEEHEQQQQVFLAQQLQQLKLQQQQQQVPVVQPSQQQQQQLVVEPVQQQLQQQTEAPGEQQVQQQQAAVPAVAGMHEMPGVAASGVAQAAAGGSYGGTTVANIPQQSVAVDAAANGQAAEQQQQDLTSQAATQQPGQEPAAVTLDSGSSSLHAEQHTPAGIADEAGVTGPASSSGQLAGQAATTAGQPSLAAAAGGTTAAAAPAALAHRVLLWSNQTTAHLQQQAQQQQQPAATQQRVQQKTQPREGASVLDTWSSTTKPKQAGNLFDIIKSEMMQMKLDQSKVSKKLDGLAKRSTDFEAVVVLLQQQQAQVMAQIDNLTTRLEKVAEQQQQQAAAARQYTSHDHHMPGTAGPATPEGAGALHHPHAQSRPPRHGHGTTAGPQVPVCGSHLHQRQLLLQPQFQWGIVAALILTCALGLCLLLHPRCALLPRRLRACVCCLAVLNGVLAALMSVWLLVAQSMLLGPAVLRVPAGPFVQFPTHRMLSSSAWNQP